MKSFLEKHYKKILLCSMVIFILFSMVGIIFKPICGQHGYDEAYFANISYNFINHGNFSCDFTKTVETYGFNHHFHHNQLYFIIAGIIFKLIGFNIINVRLLSLILIILSIFFMYKTIKIFTEKEYFISVLSVIFFFDPVLFLVAQRGRPEPLVLLFLSLGFFFLIKSLYQNVKHSELWSGLFIACSYLTHQIAIIIIIPLMISTFIYTIRKKKFQIFLKLSTSMFICVLPWIIYVLINFNIFKYQYTIIINPFPSIISISNILLVIKSLEYFKSKIFFIVLYIIGFILAVIYFFRKDEIRIFPIFLLSALYINLLFSEKNYYYLTILIPFIYIFIIKNYQEINKTFRKIITIVFIFSILNSGAFLLFNTYKLLKQRSSNERIKIFIIENIPSQSLVAGYPGYWFYNKEVTWIWAPRFHAFQSKDFLKKVDYFLLENSNQKFLEKIINDNNLKTELIKNEKINNYSFKLLKNLK